MKKTLLALVVAAVAASSANATVIYQKDGTKIDLDGRAHFEIRNEKDKRTDLRDVGSRVRVRAFQELGGNFSAFGGVEFRFSKGNQDGSADQIGSNIRAHRLFAGFAHKNVGTLTFGRQLVLGDNIPKANYTYEWGGNVFFDAHQKAVTFMSVPVQGVRFAADYYFGNADKTKSNGTSGWDQGQGYGLGLFYDRAWDKFAFRFGAGYTEVSQSNTGLKADEFKLKRGGIGFDFRYDIVTFGIDWAYGKASKDAETNNIGFQNIAVSAGVPFNKNNRFAIGAKVDVTKQNAVYAQYYFAKAKTADADEAAYKMNGWMIGADHKFNKNVAVYVEGGQARVKQDGDTLTKNHRVLVGTRIMF